MSDTRQLKWCEPFFFSLRMRNRRAWRLRIWLILAIFVAMLIGFYLDQSYGRGLHIGVLGGCIFSLAIAIFLGFLPDFTVSKITLTDDGVIRAIYGHVFGASVWHYRDIVRFELVPRQGIRPFGLLVLLMKTGIIFLGVPDSVSHSDIAESLRNRGVEQAQTPPTKKGRKVFQ